MTLNLEVVEIDKSVPTGVETSKGNGINSVNMLLVKTPTLPTKLVVLYLPLGSRFGRGNHTWVAGVARDSNIISDYVFRFQWMLKRVV